MSKPPAGRFFAHGDDLAMLKKSFRAILFTSVMAICPNIASAQLLYQPHTPQFSSNISFKHSAQGAEKTLPVAEIRQISAIRFAAPGEANGFTTGEAATAIDTFVEYGGNGSQAGQETQSGFDFPTPSMEEFATAKVAFAMTFPAPSFDDLAGAQRMLNSSYLSETDQAGVIGQTRVEAPAQTPENTHTLAHVQVPPAATYSISDPVTQPAIATTVGVTSTLSNQMQVSGQNGQNSVAQLAGAFEFPSPNQRGVTQPAVGAAAVPLGKAPQQPLVIIRDITDANTTYDDLEARYGTSNRNVARPLPVPLRASDMRSLDLAALLRRVADNDSRVHGLGFRLDAQDSREEALRGAWRPQLQTGFESDYTLLRGIEHSATIGLRQRIFDFGQTEAALITSEARRILAGARVDSQRFDVVAEFLGAYLSSLSAERGIQADSREISALRALQKATQRLAETGAASIIAARESQVSLNKALSRQSERQLEKLRADQQLASLTGGISVPVNQNDLNALVDRFMPPTAEQCISQAISSNAGLSVIEAEMVEASKHINEIAIQKLPSIDIIGQTGFSPFSRDIDFGIQRNTGFNFAINGDLFDGGVNRSEVESQQMRIRELEKQRVTAERELELNIRRAYSSAKTLQELLITQRSSLDLLRSLVSDRKRQADAGIGLLQDVLRAQVELEQAQNSLSDIENDLNRDRTRLVLLCGNRF